MATIAEPQQNSPEIPSHHKALVYDQPGKISTKIETIETPKPGVGEVLIKLTHSGVCHSDMGIMMQTWRWLPAPTAQGQVGGHEGVGHIVALGPGAEASGVKVGQRVGIKWVASTCGNCLACLSGRDAVCANGKISGFYTPGTFQQYALGPAHYVTPIPDGLASEIAAPLLCGGVTVYAALKKTGAQPGDSVVIPGSGGGLGHLALQIGRGMGFRMIGIDHGSKEQLSKECGAEAFFDLTKYGRDDAGAAELVKDVKAATPGGYGAVGVVVCTASQVAYDQSLNFVRWGGTVVCVGIPEGDVQPIKTADPASLVIQEKRIVGSAVGNRKDAIETMDLAARGVIKTRITVEPMSRLTSVFETMDKGQLQGRVVIDLTKE